jgi:trehalose 6-phosphate synthase/phosphatase
MKVCSLVSHILEAANVFSDMFRALKKFDLPADHVYTVTVGASSKQTEAGWHLLEPSDVIETITMLNNSSSSTPEY